MGKVLNMRARPPSASRPDHVAVGIDVGGNCGWAVIRGVRRVGSGVWDVSRPRNKSVHSGLRYIELAKHVNALLQSLEDHSPVVCIEKVVRHAGTDAAHSWGAIVGIVEMVCASRGVPVRWINVKSLKKFATGDGAATKVDMIREANKRWGTKMPEDEEKGDEADALWIAEAYLQGETA